MRPELSVWIMTGDGDALSIGGNHFMHLMRRNPDIKVILFNNQIYGLTKGQASPTTAAGTKTKSTPYGAVDTPIRPLPLALAAGATFAARVTDTDGDFLTEVLTQAAKHKGVAFVEVVLNCVIFNDGAASFMTDKAAKEEHTVRLAQGRPLVFGSKKDRGICLSKNFTPEIVQWQEGGNASPEVLVHDATRTDSSIAYLLSMMEHPEKPVATGIFRQVEAPVYAEKKPSYTDTEVWDALKGSDSWIEGG